MSGRKSLGRTFSFIPQGEGAVPAREVSTRASVDAIDLNPEQPRRRFDPERLAELRASIAEHGVICPLLVRRQGRRYVLIAGERRLRAARDAGLREVPIVVREGATSAGVQLELALVENLQRDDLDPIDAALGYQRLISEFGMTQEAVARAVGKERPTIANAVRLLRLPEAVLEAVRAGTLSAGHARALLPVAEHPELAGLVTQITTEGWSVRETERRVRALLGAPGLPETAPVAERLSQALGAKVSIQAGKRGGGRLTIRYASAEELDRIAALLG